MRQLLKKGKRDIEGIEDASGLDLCILAYIPNFYSTSFLLPDFSAASMALPASDNKLSFPAKP